jgi:hypothetical protein
LLKEGGGEGGGTPATTYVPATRMGREVSALSSKH